MKPKAEPMENILYKIKGHDKKKCFSLVYATAYLQTQRISPALYNLCKDRGNVNLDYQYNRSDDG